MNALILTDGKAGHENQSKAFARALGLDVEVIEVHFKSAFHKMLSYLFDRIGISTMSLFDFDGPSSTPIEESIGMSCCCCGVSPYSIVIGTGSGTFYAAKAVAKDFGIKCAVVLYPRGYKISTFDCVLAPEFDRAPSAPNVINIPSNLVANDKEFYKKGTQEFLKKHHEAKGAVGVIVGGPNKCSTMTAEWIKEELTKIFEAHPNVEKWVTTSRRTPADVEAVVDSFPFDYKLIYSRDKFNPIPAFVTLAEDLYVTAESTGMLSEACTFGTARVHVMDNLKKGPHKFRRFAESCAALGNRKIDLSSQFAKAKELLGLND